MSALDDRPIPQDPQWGDERELAASLERVAEPALITRANLASPGPTIIAVSPGLCALTGYSSRELLGKTPRLFQGPLTARTVLDELRSRCEAGEPFIGETVNYRKDGSAFILQWAIAPIRAPNGRVSHFIALQHDVTAERRYAREWLDLAAGKPGTLQDANFRMSLVAQAMLALDTTEPKERAAAFETLRDQIAAAASHTSGRT